MLIAKFDTSNVCENIKAFEDEYGFKFPEEYKNFLEKYNGGKTPDTIFNLNKISSDLTGFFGLGNVDKHYNYEGFRTNTKMNEWLEDNMLPIGENCFGDYIMLGIGEDNNGKVFFLYHDREKVYKELAKDFKHL